MGVHPFTTYVLRKYYQATGWNEDNLFSNLTRSSDGKHHTQVLFLTVLAEIVIRQPYLTSMSLRASNFPFPKRRTRNFGQPML